VDTIEDTIVRPPILLDFTDSGRIILEFPTQHPASAHGTISTSLSAGMYTITFPHASVLTVPSGNVEPIVNGVPIRIAPTTGAIVHLPQGGSVSTPSGQTRGLLSQPRSLHILGPEARVTASTACVAYDELSLI
jgi:hypothetical protein